MYELAIQYLSLGAGAGALDFSAFIVVFGATVFPWDCLKITFGDDQPSLASLRRDMKLENVMLARVRRGGVFAPWLQLSCFVLLQTAGRFFFLPATTIPPHWLQWRICVPKK